MNASFAPLGLPKAPMADELNCLRAVPKNRRDQALIEVMAGCGLRVSEACNLTLDGIHWGGDVPALRFVGKRGRERVVPLKLQAQDALRAWLEQPPAGPNSLVFRHLRSGAPLSRQAVWKSLRCYARQAGLRPVHPHMLRHAFGTALADREVPIERIRALMGHSSIQTSQLYISVSAARQREAVERLDRRGPFARWISSLRNRAYRPQRSPSPSPPWPCPPTPPWAGRRSCGGCRPTWPKAWTPWCWVQPGWARATCSLCWRASDPSGSTV